MAHNGAGTQVPVTLNNYTELANQIETQIVAQIPDQRASRGVNDHGGAEEGQYEDPETHATPAKHTERDKEATQESWSHTWGVWKGWREGKEDPELEVLWKPWDDELTSESNEARSSRHFDHIVFPKEPSAAEAAEPVFMLEHTKLVGEAFAQLRDEADSKVHKTERQNGIMKSFTKDVVSQGRTMFRACNRIHGDNKLAVAEWKDAKADVENAYKAMEAMEENVKELVAQMTQAHSEWDHRMNDSMHRLSDDQASVAIQEQRAQDLRLESLNLIQENVTMRGELEIERRDLKKAEKLRVKAWGNKVLQDVYKGQYARGREEGKILGADLAFARGHKYGAKHVLGKERWIQVASQVNQARAELENEHILACNEAYDNGWEAAKTASAAAWSARMEESVSAAEQLIEIAEKEAADRVYSSIHEELSREFEKRSKEQHFHAYETAKALGLYEAFVIDVARSACHDNDSQSDNTTDGEVARLAQSAKNDEDGNIWFIAEVFAKAALEFDGDDDEKLAKSPWKHLLDDNSAYCYDGPLVTGSDFGRNLNLYVSRATDDMVEAQAKARQALEEEAAAVDYFEVVKTKK